MRATGTHRRQSATESNGRGSAVGPAVEWRVGELDAPARDVGRLDAHEQRTLAGRPRLRADLELLGFLLGHQLGVSLDQHAPADAAVPVEAVGLEADRLRDRLHRGRADVEPEADRVAIEEHEVDRHHDRRTTFLLHGEAPDRLPLEQQQALVAFEHTERAALVGHQRAHQRTLRPTATSIWLAVGAACRSAAAILTATEPSISPASAG